jgi:hypothetical protein
MPKPLLDNASLSALAGTAPLPPKIMRTRAPGFGDPENKNAPAKYLFHKMEAPVKTKMLFIPRPTVMRPYPLASVPQLAYPKYWVLGGKAKEPAPLFPTDTPGERK